MAGDPDDLDWLDSKKVISKWRDWANRFESHYGLSNQQRRRLDELLDGKQEFVAELKTLPASVDVKELEKLVVFDGDKQRLKVGKRRLTPRELEKLLSLAKWDGPPGETPEDIVAYRKAVNDLYARASRLGYTERVVAILEQNPNVVGDKKFQLVGQLDKYRSLLGRHRELRTSSVQDFQFDHSDRVWTDVQRLRSELAGPIKAMDQALKSEAEELLTVEQLKRGAMKGPWTPLRVTDTLTIAGLTCLGLIVGLFSRFAAVMAAVMLFSFYLAMPPLPGLPSMAAGTEHSLIVNKNLIEVVALLAIAALPTGYWFGLDHLVRAAFARKQA
jgi:uncharacterized membrane protein YphA (DoxX/SURF4 family)